jgi:predicted nucleotidyltransferase component of viral defense system
VQALNSFEFLAQLRDCGLDPLFKGGSAAQLLLPVPLQRLSIDLDFATGATSDVIESVLDAANHRYGNEKNRHERRGKDIPPYLLLYSVYFPSIVDQKETRIALDFLLHEPHYKTQRMKIKTFFYESDLQVRVPTIEALLGDKMTVIADGTIGKELEEHAQSYAKQLYDRDKPSLTSVVVTTRPMPVVQHEYVRQVAVKELVDFIWKRQAKLDDHEVIDIVNWLADF